VTLNRERRKAAKALGIKRLTREQRTAIAAVERGEDVVVVLPTGAGKSAIYQVAGLRVEGPVLVVSPLIALQRDQRDGLAEADAPDAVVVNSAQRVGETADAWDAVQTGRARFLFLSPEQLARDEVIERLSTAGVGLFVVDEAHCVSEWGHDFRPEYLRLGTVIERLGHPPVVTLTATAAPPTRDDIVARLGLRDPAQVVASFDRPNLHLTAHLFHDDDMRRAEVVERAVELSANGTGLVYCATRKDTVAYADALRARDIRAAAYHAGMKGADRDAVHARFLDGDLDVVVATSAFGMGIDKPDVRFVLHAASPASLDSYYQEIGRAGRDGEPAEVTLLHHASDLNLQRFLTSRRPKPDALRAVLDALSPGEPLTPKELRAGAGLGPARVTSALNLLEQAGAVRTDAKGRVHRGELPSGDAVERAGEIAERHRDVVRSRIEMMRGYAETTDCRRRLLLGYFGEQVVDPCGHCDSCEAGTARAADPAGDGAAAEEGLDSRTTVRHPEWGEGVVMSTEPDRITVLFAEYGYKTLSLDAVRENDLLEPVGQG
jgi:ATP-dependent DNA helicase RecQ